MIDYFSPLSTARVLVVGDIILDRYVHGDTNRISPEAPVPIVKVNNTEERPGGAANVALNISALGIPVQLIGITGDDESADTLTAQLLAAGVDCEFIRREEFSTITKLRILSQHQQLLRLDYEDEMKITDTKPLLSLYKHHLEKSNIVVLSDYAKGSLNTTEEYIRQAKEQNIRVLVDPKGNDFKRYTGASLLTPNLKEFEAVIDSYESEIEFIEKATELCSSLELAALLVTRGEKGMSLFDSEEGTNSHLAAQAHEVFDVTGAGDTVIAVVAAALASNYSIDDSVSYANLAAGLVVEKLGTASVSINELNSAIENKRQRLSGVIARDKILQAIDSARGKNEKIVMTNGCFDILHAGHVKYLAAAKKLGDRLLVIVNDDNSVFRLKGENRPINAIENRMSVLDALSSTDWVSSFSEDTPEALIQLVKPDVLVKGADYSAEDIVGADFVLSYGGVVETIEFETQCSTSDIIDKVKAESVEEGS
jgi:D-beta-D-heptose 7-phosphate kinase / D-beta-D-heptose 1-phosphate adenosyltransferase